MRVVFMGTPDFAAPVLTEILAQGHDVPAVYTRAPKPAGRGLDARLSPVHHLADLHGFPVQTPKSLRGEDAEGVLRAIEPDIVVVVAYGLILPPSILAVPPSGCLNLHGSLLPRWRGAAPIQRAVMAGDRETGVMVMRMDEGLDTGPVAMAERLPIGPDDTAGDLHDRLARIGADLMGRALAAASRGSLVFRPQDEAGVTYAHKIEKAEAAIDWSRPAAEVHNAIRGLSPFPGAFLEADFGRGVERLKVLRSTLGNASGPPGIVLPGDDLTVACGEGAVRLLQVQRAGRPPMDAAAFRRGTRLEAGTSLARAL